MAISRYLANVWSATDFGDPALSGYAEQHMRVDTRIGVQSLASLALLMQLLVALLIVSHDITGPFIYSSLLFALLSLHILVSAAFVDDVKSLQTLGISFLVIGAMTITFLAHRTGDLSVGMMAAIVLMFAAIPLIPWALREATIVISLTYLLLTVSFAIVPGRFTSESLWILQLLVLGAAAVASVITVRNTYIRKNDIRARFELENARNAMEQLSLRDHLTGAWNRRFLDERFPSMAEECFETKRPLHVAVLDIDDFKGINDRFGHDVGDKILCAVATTFIRHLGDSGHLIRLGGDEFQIVYCGDDLDYLIETAIQELQQDQTTQALVDRIPITLSAGITSSDVGTLAELDTLYKTADRALYNAKENRPLIADSSNALARTGTWQL